MKWHKNPHNEVLACDGFYISYNPKTGQDPISALCAELSQALGAKDRVNGHAETALIVEDKNHTAYILIGDWREQFEAAAKEGLYACIKVFNDNREHRSPWSDK